ncbi:MAG: serine--tRNA ligase [Candidatus Komeilibacteria bacterium RIFCSPLOWO2_01_FULL_52_15]|uniref:Serine--tRNA ligase n=2 Tax=Candidatus Komeiliibacteriota TaxID=1817908 RepID=A0A1G2BMT6_9BACT|nr:MAG: serine--tRNA ligase [Candidatus Komeilibacteria bacterium RIFCSPHIGHO2_01_FULL_52_14]OGY90441.1 MAG: serine--tRNA ligase [Candidatus Komeilibacteria bacterium RIFCSPLOWO2_01_FULL_52_15]
MLDINFIIENKKKVEEAIRNKGIKCDLKALLSADKERRSLLQKVEELNRKRNENAASMKPKGAKPDPRQIEEGKRIKEELAKLDPALREVEARFNDVMLRVPNVYSDDTPVGKDDSENKELRTWGKIPKFDFPAKDHLQLGTELDLIDTERGTKVVGFRGYFLKNDLARLHWAVMTYAFNKMIAKGYSPFITPSLVNEIGLTATGWFPLVKDQVYPVEDKFLSGTAEVALMGYRANEIIETKELPLKYCGFSPCFRREAGSYGKDTKGLYRVHEFWKVEQVVICENDLSVSLALFEELLHIAEEILQDLGLAYRVLAICTGDMGAGKYKMYDIETWMPSRKSYGETHSCSLLTDWQARRANIRYRASDGSVRYPHTMNNTVIASPRILIALLENYQQADGTIAVPKVLQPLMGGQKSIGA